MGLPSHKKPSAQPVKFDAAQRMPLTPRARVDFYLEQIEARASRVVAQAEEGMAVREARAKRALDVYRRRLDAKKSKTPDEEVRCAEAARAYVDASNAVRSRQWFEARDALLQVEAARKSLEAGKADEAVEAACNAMNATWRFEAARFEKPVAVGEKFLALQSNGGKRRAAQLSIKNAERDANICHRAKMMKDTDGASIAEIASALSERFNLSKRQIKRILSNVDMR